VPGDIKLANQIHDYNVHVDRNDVFWMIPTKNNSVEVDFDDARATLSVRGLNVFDDHDLANSLTQGLGIPGIPPVFPVRAKVSFDIEWDGVDPRQTNNPAQINNSSQKFKGTFFATNTTIKWSSEQEGFAFESEAPDPTRNLISVLGHEQNGVFFS
jgi:hypothetical protein